MITFTTPAVPPVTIDMPCEWPSSMSVGYFYPVGPVAFGGEDVFFDLNPRGSSPYLFNVGRSSAASYWAGPDTGTETLIASTTDWAHGTIAFTDLAPDADTAPPGPIPTPLADWIRPIGDDAAYARLTGTVEWSCDPAPATVPTPGPSVGEHPERTPPPIPALTLVEGSRHDLGLEGCGGSIDIDGWTASDSCGPSFQAPDATHIVRIKAGADLQFQLPANWRFGAWTVGWVAQAEAERWRGEVPDTLVEVAHGDTADGRSLTVAAPPVGDWTVLVVWSGLRGSDSVSGWSDYFRVVVGD